MSTDLVVQLRSYLETIGASAPPITVDELEQTSGQMAGPAHESADDDLTVFDLRRPGESAAPRPRKRRAMVVALGIAAGVLLVVGVVVADRDSGNVATDAVSSPSVAEPVAPAAPMAPAVAADSSLWSLVSYESGTGLLGVVAGGPGFVAVGGSDGDAAVWTSVDGLTWSRVAHDEAVFGGEGESGMAAVAVGGPGLVAVGSQYVCTEEEVLDETGSPRVDEVGNPEPDTVCVDGNAVVWTSVDGLTWTRVPHDEAVFGGRRRVYQMSSVAPGGPGLVAVGRSSSFGEGDPLNEGDVREGDAVVWTSVDGLAWSRVAHDETVFGGLGFQEIVDVTAGGPGLVAVGRDGTHHGWDNSRQNAAVWVSVDGLTWTRVPHDKDAFGGGDPVMLGVTAGGPGLVAVGRTVGGGQALVWTSVDGLSWSRVTHDNPAEMRENLGDVAVGGPGLVAVGGSDDEDPVWTSPDGLIWSLDPNISVPWPGP